MSFLHRGEPRRAKASGVLVTVLSLAAFQVLAIVGAGSAAAVSGCTYNPATDTINITIDPGQAASVAVETAADDLDTDSPPGAILFSASDIGGGLLDYENGANSTQCGSASTSNTVAIIVLGQPSNDEFFLIDEEFSNAQFPSTIAWAVDLGSQTVGGFDEFAWWSTDPGGTLRHDTATFTDTSFDINGGMGELVGVETMWIYPGIGDDVVDASALSNVILREFNGGDGDDWVAPGAQATLPIALVQEDIDGQDGTDTVSYGTRTTSTTVRADAGLAGRDANADCDVLDAGDEQDLISNFEAFETGSGNDCLVGDTGVDETFIPGDGDDDITGNAADDDVIDWSSSSAAMTIDPANGTATGQGTDTFADVFAYVGSAFDDVLIWDGTTTFFSGGDGTDTVDASATTTSNVIDLDTLDGLPLTGVGAPADDLENAIGGSANDILLGNDARNRLEGGDGDDTLSGMVGNDLLLGGAGNDTYTGGPGADKVSFINSPNGVNVDMLLGFATGEGDDGFGDVVEIVVGSGFGDSITGGGGVVAINFLFNGRGGDDILTGSGSNDTLKGGGGNDVLRGVNGDDTLTGARGNDRIFGGPGVDVGKGGPGKDTCKGVEIKSSCGTPGSPKLLP